MPIPAAFTRERVHNRNLGGSYFLIGAPNDTLSRQENAKRFARQAITYALLAIILSFFVWEMRVPIEQMDDAFISYHYAQHLVEGHGLVFNVGERVEGYTNLLWVLLIAAGIKLGLAAPILGHWLCVGAGILLLLASYLYCAILLPRSARPLALLAPLLLLSFNCFVKWTSSGLEQGFFSALVLFALCAATLRKFWVCAILCVLATLTRPEGALVALLLLNLPWVTDLSRGEARHYRALLRLAAPAAAFGIFMLLLTLFRWLYYGDFVPNTYYAKVGGIPAFYGWVYVALFLLDGPGLLLAGAVVAAIMVPRYRLGLVFTTLFFAYIIAIRGDVFADSRFLLPVLSVLVAGGVLSVHELSTRHRFVAFGLALLLPAAAFVSLYVLFLNDGIHVAKAEFPYSVKHAEARVHIWHSPAEMQARLEAIAHAEPPIHLVASVGIGRLGYYCRDLRVLDLVGLIDKTIAKSTRKSPERSYLVPGHQRSDPDYVFSRKPDLIDIPAIGAPVYPRLPAIVDLWNDPRLETDYHLDYTLGGYRINPP